MARFRRTGEICSCCGKYELFARTVRTPSGRVRVDICPACDFMKHAKCGQALAPLQQVCCGVRLQPMPQSLGLIDINTTPPGGWGN